jgi:hypothetical protein
MPDLTVVTEGLDAISANLEQSRQGLEQALNAMRDGTAAGLGSPELDAACADYHDAWQYGLGQLASCVDTVRAGIDSVKQLYLQNDAEIAQACRR